MAKAAVATMSRGQRHAWPLERSGVSTCERILPACLLLATGCATLSPNRAAIQSADAGRRILAIYAAAEAKDWQAVPLIVDRLEDEDEAVRFFAILALERITGQRFGYDYARPARERAGPVRRWREYVQHGSHAALSQAQDASAKGSVSKAPTSPTRSTLP